MPGAGLSDHLFISDLDGTLLLPSRVLGQRSRRVLERLIAKGGLFTVATGRSGQSAAGVLGDLRLPIDAIVHNGALTVNLASGAVSRVAPLPGPVAARLFDRAVAAGMAPVAYALPASRQLEPGEAPPLFCAPRPNDPTSRYVASVARYHPLVEDDGTRLADCRLLSMMLLDDPVRIESFFAAECDPRPGVSAYPGRSAYTPGLGVGEITAVEAGKASAAQKLCHDLLGRGLEAVVAFGDNLNDLPLLVAAGEAYCPPDAPGCVLEQVGGRIAPPSEEGVALHLEQRLAAQ